MVKGVTSSGFSFTIPDNLMTDFRFLKTYAKMKMEMKTNSSTVRSISSPSFFLTKRKKSDFTSILPETRVAVYRSTKSFVRLAKSLRSRPQRTKQ